ncbi:MAG TPA: hypothetical protein VL461_04040 [Dictyobacter sp.]|jgi:glucosamine--fructose-6-phosphate aminotransferase (isomerizing)|nr:hypothetical protein [Dictyobacter sp.]
MHYFALDEQIAAQSEALRLLQQRIVVPQLDASRPIYFTGIGTSLHACRIAADWARILSQGAIRPLALSAHDLALYAPLHQEDQIIVVSHRGTKRFPTEVFMRARQVGATTIAVVGEEAPEQVADITIRTCPGEKAGTHTVSYSSALYVVAHLVGRLVGERGKELLDALTVVPGAIDQVLAQPAPVEVAEQLQAYEPLLITGSGLDAITAEEIALKFKEGTYTWAEGMDTENALHGPPAAYRQGMAAITITPAHDDGGRTVSLRTLCQELGVYAIACGSADEVLQFPAVPYLVRPFVALVPLQRLVAELARLKQTNPDLIHGDQEPWATAMGNVML